MVQNLLYSWNKIPNFFSNNFGFILISNLQDNLDKHKFLISEE